MDRIRLYLTSTSGFVWCDLTWERRVCTYKCTARTSCVTEWPAYICLLPIPVMHCGWKASQAAWHQAWHLRDAKSVGRHWLKPSATIHISWLWPCTPMIYCLCRLQILAFTQVTEDFNGIWGNSIGSIYIYRSGLGDLLPELSIKPAYKGCYQEATYRL